MSISSEGIPVCDFTLLFDCCCMIINASIISFNWNERLHESENFGKIMNVNCIKVNCNLISGSICDTASSQTIHKFYPSVPPRYKTIEVSRYKVFYPLNFNSISKINIVLRDQDNNLINLRG